MPKRKICIVTGSRADYGLLYWPMKRIQESNDFELQILATGMHLSEKFGNTYKVIEEDFTITKKVEMDLTGDSNFDTIKSLGLALPKFAEAFDEMNPDLVMILGDRYEMFAATQAAYIGNRILIHLFGGDTTEGAQDEAFRHSMTKMSYLHFVSNEVSRKRVVQLGEHPERVFNVGSTGIDFIKNLKVLSKETLENSLDFKFREKNILVTYHPVTLESGTYIEDFAEVLRSLESLGDRYGIIFTKSNSDPGGRKIGEMIDEFVLENTNSKAYFSLGQLKYLSVMKQVDFVLGNSSSGLYEVPSMKIPTINIGDRQKGRLQSESIINCSPITEEIKEAIGKANELDCSKFESPYGSGNSSEKIVNKILNYDFDRNSLKKEFYMNEGNDE